LSLASAKKKGAGEIWAVRECIKDTEEGTGVTSHGEGSAKRALDLGDEKAFQKRKRSTMVEEGGKKSREDVEELLKEWKKKKRDHRWRIPIEGSNQRHKMGKRHCRNGRREQ